MTVIDVELVPDLPQTLHMPILLPKLDQIRIICIGLLLLKYIELTS